MRTGALALLLVAAACGQRDGGNRAEAVPGVGGHQSGTRIPAVPRAAITIAATGPGGCEARWDGQVVTPAEITQRGVAMLERAIDAAGGVQNMTGAKFPVPNVAAPADLSFACADTILFALQRAGMVSVRLRPVDARPSVLADFPFDTNAPPPPVPTVLGIGAGGRMTWNEDPIDAAGLAARLGRIGGTAEPDLDEGEAPPGGLELRVRREATFGQVHALLRTTRRYHLRPFLYLPSAEAGAGQPAAPPPPPAAPPPPPSPPR